MDRHMDTWTRTGIVGYRKRTPLYAHVPLPVLRSHTPGAAPGPLVKTGARVHRFRGCN